jgi:hypothetical protein
MQWHFSIFACRLEYQSKPRATFYDACSPIYQPSSVQNYINFQAQRIPGLAGRDLRENIMQTNTDIDMPHALQGLGLNQEQLHHIYAYFKMRVDIGKKQRYSLIGLALVLPTPFFFSTFIGVSPEMPYQSFVSIALQWMPLAVLISGVVSIGIQLLLVRELDKFLPNLGLTERAIKRIQGAGRTIAIVAILGRPICDRLFKLFKLFEQ